MSISASRTPKEGETSGRRSRVKGIRRCFQACRGGYKDGSRADSTPVETHTTPRRRPPLNDAQRELASRYLPFATALAKRMHELVPGERDELESTAFLALVEAAQTFDPAMSVNFATYARYRITGALRDFRRWRFGEGRRGEKTCRPMILSIGDGLESYGNALGVKSQWPVGAEFEAADTVEQWLRRLPERQAEICRLIYLDGMSQDEVADLLGRSRSSISRQHQEALARLTGQVEQFQTAGGSTAFDWTTS